MQEVAAVLISINAAVGMDGPQTVGDIVDEIATADKDGFDAAWVPSFPPLAGIAPWDALTTLAIAGAVVPGIALGTAVVVAYAHHPLVLAAQALTTQAATDGRLTLGVGLSHQAVIEGAYGYPFERPAAYLREYLEVLLPALRGEAVSHRGERIVANGQLGLPGAEPPAVVLAALGPQLLRLAGELTDGTVTAWTGVSTVANHIVPRITAAAGGRRTRVIVGLPVCVTNDVEQARNAVADRFSMAMSFPSYKAMLDFEGVDSVADVVTVGDEEAVAAELGRFVDAGATEICALPFGTADERRRGVELLTGLSR